jgi:hypothetical protein
VASDSLATSDAVVESRGYVVERCWSGEAGVGDGAAGGGLVVTASLGAGEKASGAGGSVG